MRILNNGDLQLSLIDMRSGSETVISEIPEGADPAIIDSYCPDAVIAAAYAWAAGYEVHYLLFPGNGRAVSGKVVARSTTGFSTPVRTCRPENQPNTMKKIPIIRFTTKQGFTARPDLKLAGSWEYLRRVARETLAIHHADAYTYSIEKDGHVQHYSAEYHTRI